MTSVIKYTMNPIAIKKLPRRDKLFYVDSIGVLYEGSFSNNNIRQIIFSNTIKINTIAETTMIKLCVAE